MPRFRKGDYRVYCDISGLPYLASECRMMWNGLFVHKSLWMPQHPQDKTAPTIPPRTPKNARPEGTLSYISATDVTTDDL